ncbi:Txe/YoeB family addiction module toxin [Nocardia puris]|uniref:Endoribonuclease YoeB n=1 Tax=Nocardia puris TaxID=208602 RepID=A0A366DDX9_9NOCA|nr:Txe/YoeB family addiction module toxin [Nocardia puris]MBF6214490.1 Txe/YoeB family addiction module toxin [Nocardia puris]MBF6365899.1 Txe/YoeB family addiction module toxin [Nocardia puris]MBF6460458.1 Txe/YoeB family addiction module toxin [Nocardia puris]RBO87458.1 toxin YoeB [Nocardia puris]
MRITFTPSAWAEYLWWQVHDKQTLRRLNRLSEDIGRNGYEGIGKPEPLRHDLAGYWSRRVTSEHRIVYAIEGDTVVIVACRYHYE